MNNIFSENLKKLRNSKHLTQEQVAEALKVSPQSVSRWECGNTFPDIMLLPEIARLYSVTVDDLYRENSYAYPNYAARLSAIYEESHALEDFIRVDAEYSRIMKAGTPTMDDLRLYAIAYHQLMHDARRKALSLYDQALARGPEDDREIYYRVKRQKTYMLFQIGRGEEALKAQEESYAADPNNPEEAACLISAYFDAKQYAKVYEFYQKVIVKFPNEYTLHVYGGDACKELKNYEQAFACWEKALALNTRWYDVKYSMAFCHEEMGEYQKAYDMWICIAEEGERDGFEIESKMPRERAAKCLEKLQN